MYTPHDNAVGRADVVRAMRDDPFAVLVTTTAEDTYVTHLPVMTDEVDGTIVLTAHLARANPHADVLEQGRSVMIFSGPHAFVSAALYEGSDERHDDGTGFREVPTWNYVAVHIHGTVTIIHDATAVHAMLDRLMATFDPAYTDGWAKIDHTYVSNLQRGIVAFTMRAHRVHARAKVSQNRSAEDQRRVHAMLSGSDDPMLRRLAAWINAPTTPPDIG